MCGFGKLTPLLDMGSQPLAERYVSDRRYPLALLQCGNCSLVQLSYIVPQQELFPPGHPYVTGNSPALREHFSALADSLSGYMSPGDLVVDIGANDGTLLGAFRPDVVRLAVEPTGQVRKCQEKGLLATQAFFTAALAQTILADRGPARIIAACNVMAHVPDPHNFMDGVADLLADRGVFVTENHSLESITAGLQIDTVYHEHLRYYSPASLGHLLAMHGMELASVHRIPAHGGSFRALARKRRGDLSSRAQSAARDLRRTLSALAASGHGIYGIGATTRATPLIHYAHIAPLISCVCEVAGSEKIGKTMPGTSIPIVPEDKLIADQPPYALLLSWHIADIIIPKLRLMGYHGRFIIPLPEPRIVDD